MHCNFVLTTFYNFYGNRHIDHANYEQYIVQRYVDLKPQPSPPQMLGFFYYKRNPHLLCRSAAFKRRSSSVGSIDVPIRGPQHIPPGAGVFLSVIKALCLKEVVDLSNHFVKYSGQSPFFRNRLRNENINKKFRQKRGMQVGSIAKHAEPKSEDKSNPFTPTKINALVKPDT